MTDDHADLGKDGRRYKLTFKQEAFCHAYMAHEGNASAAYREVYDAKGMTDEQIWTEASLLLSSPKVAKRVEELQQAAMERHETTVDSITTKLSAAFTMAKTTKQPAAMTSAALGEAKLHGLLIEKREVQVTTKDLSDEQIEAELAAIRAESEQASTRH